MENQSYIKEFKLFSFSAITNYRTFITSMFFFLYIFGVLINSIIITVICIDYHLHTPMYQFLCNLALVDICYTTTIVPKLLHMLLSGDNTVPFIECFTQLYFYLLVGCTEDLLIFIMAYDRYVAICDPLHYHYILSRRNCHFLASFTWMSGCINAIVITLVVSHFSFCKSHAIHQFFCDPKALISISCAGSEEFYNVIFLETLVFVFFPAMFIFASYLKIIRVILQIKSEAGRKRAFSTCSSHLIIIVIYYTTGLSVYMMPPSESSNVVEPVFTILYSVVTPMMNPLIYSLRNKEVKSALLRLLRLKFTRII